MQLTEALKLIRNSRKPILFVGSGFANQALNLDGEFTPSSKQLVKRILSQIPLEGESDTPLSFAIDQLREAAKPIDAYQFISRQLTVADATLEQLRILSLPWHRIYTTNIDNIGTVFSKRRCLDAATDTSAANSGDYIYLHGCLANCQSNNYYQRVKMGEQLYLAGSHSNSPYHNLLHQDLHESDCVIVIGYSMGDPDLVHLFYNSTDLINKCFVFSGDTSALDNHRISLIGTDTKQTSTAFLAAHDATPIDTTPTFSSQIEVDYGGYDIKTVSQISRQNLLIYGRFDRNIARTSWADVEKPIYAIARGIGRRIAQAKSASTIIIHSHLGNGKTLILEYARHLVANANRPVFTIEPSVDEDSLSALLQEIPVGSFVFFEGDIFLASRVQEIIASRALIFCCTSRTTTMRVAASNIYNNKKTTIDVFDCNRLNDDELVEFHTLISSMGFWPPSLSDLSEGRRLDILKTRYEGSTCAIVLSIFENEDIRNQIEQQWSSYLPNLRPYLDHFVVGSYMNMIDVDAPPYLIKEFQSSDYREISEAANDIVSVSSYGVITFSNAIIGEFVFQNLVDKEIIIGAIVRFANFIDNHYAQRRYQRIANRLLRFWNLSRILNSTKLPEMVFDRASYIPSLAGDPLFWVQYSISKMENGEFLPAKRFVDTAYAKAKDRGQGFDTYQIDTHAARLTIRKLMDSGVYEGFAADLNRSVIALRNVAERRSDDLYHVSAVVTSILNSEIPYAFEMSEREYSTFRKNIIAIGDQIDALTKRDFSFAPERQAAELIDKLRTH
ncbi:hypothetical protein [Mariluticola halotolerans]|uniref:hypothetical protein n=1 Tax=Mariluticola halotolerans TaxID=2909283 RepID=UPI0026E2BC5E|nr:hypothetical protein [Mariluticola halotolerans]UJQ94460.1 hypothetical protein L1P08_00250 [Mariluticola halotolerans]